MNSDNGWPTSFSGFLDYSICFPTSQSWLWQFIGWYLFGGTIISLAPQLRLIVSQRSSFGLNSFAIFVTSFGQFIIVVNVLCLRATDFAGMLQFPLSYSISRLQTFINYLTLWLTYLPIAFMNMLFFDKEPRLKRPADSIRADKYFNHMLTILNPIVALLIAAVFAAGTALFGVGSSWIVTVGKFFGTFATFMCVAQYVPQMITTCRLKSSGSLSLALLAMQSPGGFLNAAFMWFGQGDDWTTWISILAAAVQQAILLGICIFFKVQKKRQRQDPSDASMSDPLLANQDVYQ
jgi:uncharacterized protein with PQ loop repeat